MSWLDDDGVPSDYEDELVQAARSLLADPFDGLDQEALRDIISVGRLYVRVREDCVYRALEARMQHSLSKKDIVAVSDAGSVYLGLLTTRETVRRWRT